jgi:membrane-bound lytic murein transglycosylase B
MMPLYVAWAAVALAGVAVIPSAAFSQSAPAFRAFLERIRPDAEARGVSRATFEAATTDLTPDLSLPDLITLGREEQRKVPFSEALVQQLTGSAVAAALMIAGRTGSNLGDGLSGDR